MTAFRFVRFLLPLLVLGTVAGCASDPRDPAADTRAIEQVLDARHAAMQARDGAAYAVLFSPNYHDRLGGRAEVVRAATDLFATYDSIELRISGRKVELRGDEAVAVQDYFLVATSQGLDQSLKGSERLVLRHEGGRWLIAGGLND